MEKNYLKDIIYGVCVGDALGVPVEFESRENLKKNPVKNMREGGIHEQGRGTWSDDSSLTLCLAESIIEGFDLQNLANKFIAWEQEGYWTAGGEVFDIGNTTRQSINNLKREIKPTQAGGKLEIDNGNGSLMRILPLVILIKDMNIEDRFNLVKEVSSITHAHSRSVLACFYYLEFALEIINGKDKFEIYENLKHNITNFCIRDEDLKKELIHFDRLLKGNIYELLEEDIKSGGYVIDTVEATFWSLLTTTNYEDAVIRAVNLGGDTDTTAAVTGGLASLLYEFKSIPKRWLNWLPKRNELNMLIHRYKKQQNTLLGKMTIIYKLTTIGEQDRVNANGCDSEVLFENLSHELDINLNLTNEDGVNSISLNFNYPKYPLQGFIECDFESDITSSNENFYFLFDPYEFSYIDENNVIISGTLAINKLDSEDVDCFDYELIINKDNCKKIIQNSTIGSVRPWIYEN